jgi:hypothetical protein
VKRRVASSALAVAVLFAVPTVAYAAAPEAPATAGPPPNAILKVRVGHLRGGRAPILSTVPVAGSVNPFAPGQSVELTFYLDGKKLLNRTVRTRPAASGAGGVFQTKILIRKDGRYAVSAHLAATESLRGASTKRTSWRVTFPALHPGECDRVVKAFKENLAKMGYVAGGGSCFNGRTGREVLAYRKVNDMARSERAGRGLVQSVFGEQGGYHVRYPGAGEHAEVPLSKQVLVLAKGDKPFAIYPVSTGKPSTPTITGHYQFYLRSPGYNSEGMYYSFYWHNGYAVHGYAEVPNYAASHGCVRTFIADQPRIYEQLNYGESIFVF